MQKKSERPLQTDPAFHVHELDDSKNVLLLFCLFCLVCLCERVYCKCYVCTVSSYINLHCLVEEARKDCI